MRIVAESVSVSIMGIHKDSNDCAHREGAMTTDIAALIERLRRNGRGLVSVDVDRMEAAAELERLQAEVALLTAELEAARRDAERYRWLRDRSIPEQGKYHLAADAPLYFNPAAIDAAIDADLWSGAVR